MTETQTTDQAPGQAATDNPLVGKAPTRNQQRASRAARGSSDAVQPRKVATGATTGNDPLAELVCITLHDSKEIPPNGQYVAVNGHAFLIPPGRKVWVPRYICEALSNAIKGEPIQDDKLSVTGHLSVPRLPFTVHFGERPDDSLVA